MTYAVASALQRAVYERLSGDTGLVALVGAAVFDAAPEGDVPEVYVTLGSETVRDMSDATGRGARHDLVVSVVSGPGGFRLAKEVAAAVADALNTGLPMLERGTLVALNFLKARARRDAGGQARRIDMTFRALVQDN